jgi:hypothetical protein
MPMFARIDTKDPEVVEREVRSIYDSMFPEGNKSFVPQAFQWASDYFNGRYDNYQPIDARYHDFEHTLQGTLCLVRLLERRHRARVPPILNAHWFELALLAILFHDTGYLKRCDDVLGTGAKYTLTHVTRSAEFAEEFLKKHDYKPSEIRAIQNMIRCTGVNVGLGTIPFASEMEKVLGLALGTADLLGQMAAADYVEKLPILYLEFDESARFNKGTGTLLGRFRSAQELMRHTPIFWETYVKPKIDGDFQKLYRFLEDPYPNGPNWYLCWVEANIDRLRRQSAAMSAA